MKKRIISLALSAITAVSAVTAISTNALQHWGTVDEEAIAETFKDCVQLENQEWLGIEDTKYMFLRNTERDSIYLYEVYRSDDFMMFNIKADAEIEAIKDKISKLDSSLKVRANLVEPAKIEYSLFVESKVISPEIAKEICEIIGNDNLYSIYNHNQTKFQNIICDYMTAYCPKQKVYDGITNEIIEIEQEEKILEYAEAHSDVFDVIKYEGGESDFRGVSVLLNSIYLIPKKEVTKEEHIALAEEIHKATGCYPMRYSLEGANSSGTLGGLNLDLTDYLNGDANRDKTTTIADAAAIMQAIANPDKYALSDLGEFNADFACDGLTVDDAVAIQKKLAGIL